eukprot:6175360-Pleurochrysis_carterae.AAC.1
MVLGGLRGVCVDAWHVLNALDCVGRHCTARALRRRRCVARRDVRRVHRRFARPSVRCAQVLGIIDLPQEWTLKCELGRAFKTVECVLRGENPLDISTVPVDYYQERFCTFFKETLFKRSRRSQVRKDERPALQAMNDNLSTDCIPIQERRDSL